VLDGREGNDTLSFELRQFAPETPVEVDLSQANDQTMGDDLIVVGFENIEGSGFSDTFSGNDAPNVLTGQAGLDRLDGGGNDDRLIGGSDDDTLIGGLGSDVLTGGLGQDFFVFNTKTEGADTISDFERDIDNLPFDRLAISATGFGTDDFTAGMGLTLLQLQPEVLASGNDARFVWREDAGDVLLSFDSDGDGPTAPTLMARIAINLPILTTADFIVF
jgi:Ca2+-binding RTX toxin-like protein